MGRYDDSIPLWDYSDNANYDDRAASDRAWDRSRAERAARIYAAADDGDRRYGGQGGNPAGGGRRPRRIGDRYSQRAEDDRHYGRGYGESNYRRGESDDYFGDMSGGSHSFWPSEFGYPASRGYSPYGGRVPSAYDREDRGFLDRAGDEVLSWFGDRDARRRREIDHRGRGPKNYTRSDERIRDDVNDRLTQDVWIDASEVEVMVADGEVTLSGTVENRRAKRRAEDCADEVSGVKHVQNNLRYQSGVESPQVAG